MFAIAATVAFAGTASAGTMILRLTDLDTASTVTINDDQIGFDGNLTTGVISFNGTVGAFTINATTGASKPIVGPGALSLTSLQVTDNTAGLHHLLVELTDTGFSTPAGLAYLTQSITNNTLLSAGGSLVANAYESNTNGAFAYGGLATPTATVGAGIVGGDVKNSATTTFTPLYSLSEKVLLTINGPGSANWTANLTSNQVPEPASLLLLGGGLLALRRKLQKKVSA